MALVREPKKTLPCDAEFAVETETSFSVLDGADSVITYDEYLNHPWERIQLLAGALGAEPGNDGSWTWTNVTAGVSSSSSSLSPVTFHGHDEEGCAAWMDTTDQLSFGAMALGHATGSASPSILSINMDDMLPTKRPRTHHGAPEEAATAARKRAKEPTAAPPKETQRTSAKNRREHVNERMKVLQELVPNGRKVDTVTMLDKAITYVKFMQLQLKVLETDAFWPTQAGKAPEMSRVKETLDAILFSSTSSQCDH